MATMKKRNFDELKMPFPRSLYEVSLSGDNIENDNESIFENVSSKWGGMEELNLLEFVCQSGLYNWEKVAQSLSHTSGKCFHPKEVQDHFLEHYLDGTLGQVWNYHLVENPVQRIDHTESKGIDDSATSRYLPAVSHKQCKSIQFFPHREEFEEYPFEDIEITVASLDFSSYYMANMRNFKIEQEIKDLQLAIVDSYCRTVAERIELYKFMKDFKLIEQYFLSEQRRPHDNLKSKSCELKKTFRGMQKFIGLFESSTEFLNFYFDCVRENLLKLEIARLIQCLIDKKNKNRCSVMKSLLKIEAPICYSNLRKVLYYKRQKGEKEKFNLLEEKGPDEMLNSEAHDNLLEAILQHQFNFVLYPIFMFNFILKNSMVPIKLINESSPYGWCAQNQNKHQLRTGLRNTLLPVWISVERENGY